MSSSDDGEVGILEYWEIRNSGMPDLPTQYPLPNTSIFALDSIAPFIYKRQKLKRIEYQEEEVGS